MQRSADDIVEQIAFLEKDLAEQETAIQNEYPEVFSRFKKMEKQKEDIDKLKASLKNLLVELEDFDAHEAGGKKYSVSRITKLSVANIDLVPDEFKNYTEVADERKAQDYFKLMGEIPEGFADKSYYKLNLKDAL